MGYSPLLVWQTVAAGMVSDPSFGRAVSVLGMHDTCGLPTTGYRCMMAAGVRTLAARMGKRLWEAELGATPATGTNPMLPGPGGLARALNARLRAVRDHRHPGMAARRRDPARSSAREPRAGLGRPFLGRRLLRHVPDLGDRPDHSVHRSRLALPGHRQQSRIPVRTRWAGKPRILSGALREPHRPLGSESRPSFSLPSSSASLMPSLEYQLAARRTGRAWLSRPS